MTKKKRAKKRATKRRATKRRAAKTRGAKRQFVLDTSDVKGALAVHIRKVEAIVRKHEKRVDQVGRRSPKGKEAFPKLTQARRALNAMRAARSAMQSMCECEPAQPCPLDL